MLKQYVTIKAGQPLSLRDVQTSVKSLFSTGDFRDVRVEETPADGGVGFTSIPGGVMAVRISSGLHPPR